MSLNPSQVQAGIHKDGPCMVLAGPGSGKTLTITKRIEYLIGKHHVSPEEILVITFTKAASIEMKERFVRLCGQKAGPVTFGTFHGIYLPHVSGLRSFRGHTDPNREHRVR